MTTIESPVKSIDQLRFWPLPKKPLANVEFVYATNEGRSIIIKAKDGRIYTNAIAAKCYYPFGNDHPTLIGFLDGLYRAKIITRKALMEHKRKAAKTAESRRMHRIAIELKKYALEAGVEFTAAQLQRLEKLDPKK